MAVSVKFEPAVTVPPDGCCTIQGAVGNTSGVAAALVTLPTKLVTTTW